MFILKNGFQARTAKTKVAELCDRMAAGVVYNIVK